MLFQSPEDGILIQRAITDAWTAFSENGDQECYPVKLDADPISKAIVIVYFFLFLFFICFFPLQNGYSFCELHVYVQYICYHYSYYLRIVKAHLSIVSNYCYYFYYF